jgi:hypothetical protein
MIEKLIPHSFFTLILSWYLMRIVFLTSFIKAFYLHVTSERQAKTTKRYRTI